MISAPQSPETSSNLLGLEVILHGFSGSLTENCHQIVLRYLVLLFQASYSNHRRPVSMASQKCYLGYINHPNTKGWDGAKAIPPSTANNICQVSARLHKVSPCLNLSESEV